MRSSNYKFFDNIFKYLLLAYLAILPISHTVALRNLLLVILVFFILVYAGMKRSQLAVPLSQCLHKIPAVVFLWIIFLFLFPLWAVQPDVAWMNLKGQWIQSILAWFVGFGAVLILGQRGPGLWALALSSAFSVAVHLFLLMAAWGGMLGGDFYVNPSITTAWQSFSLSQLNTLNWQQFPVGFRGIEPMHGNLGYTACQAIALFCVCFSLAWREKINSRLLTSCILIILCFLSLFVAQSRGAILFGLLILLLAAIAFIFKWRDRKSIESSSEFQSLISKSKLGVAFVALLLLFFAFQSVKDQERWYSMADKVKIGLLSENPINILCNGISPKEEKQISAIFSHRDPAYIQVLLDGLKGQDGGRILLMRAGLDLVVENPRGLDGSKQSYQKLIKEKCGHDPVLLFSHAHQGWIDIALALGWIGILLFACLFLYFLRMGWQNIESVSKRSWAMALFLISVFWIFRGFADGVYREHYLQMQALLLAYLSGGLLLNSVVDRE
jgi:hypothetical protein